MRKISYKDLQLSLEKDLFQKIIRGMKRQGIAAGYLNKPSYNRDKLALPGQAMEVEGHYNVKYILDRIETIFKPNINIRVFLYQSVVFNISCFQYDVNEEQELHIYVSQHFFNNLNEEEQVGIIGHEISHHLLGHLGYPLNEIISDPYITQAEASLKSNIIYWNKACEITADILGLVANDFNYKAYSTAIIKHFTGLSESTLSNFNILPLIALGLEQYEQFANDPLFNDAASTHPSIMLRLKIINTITQSKLIRHYGQNESLDNINTFKKEYNDIINKLIEGIYPEIFSDKKGWSNILIPMTMAVILADQKIDDRELIYFEELFSSYPRKRIEKYKRLAYNSKGEFEELIQKFVGESIEYGKNHGYNKHRLVPIIRKLLLVADSDGKIEKRELNCIFQFGEAFGFTREDIVILVQTQYRIIS